MSQVDQVEMFTYSAAQAALITEELLDHRFGLLSKRLTDISSGPSAPAVSSAPEDPRDLLRALARVDSERPPKDVGDSVRRARREVQRAGAGEGGERRLTSVGAGAGAAATAGTPGRRGGTPGRERTPGR